MKEHWRNECPYIEGKCTLCEIELLRSQIAEHNCIEALKAKREALEAEREALKAQQKQQRETIEELEQIVERERQRADEAQSKENELRLFNQEIQQEYDLLMAQMLEKEEP
jgi:chromosome segregation ATPase